MNSPMTTHDLESLVERVKAATGQSLELDLAILPLWDPAHDALKTWSDDYQTEFRHGRGANGFSAWKDGFSISVPFPAFTASVDAALALVERVLPGWVCETLSQDAVGRLGEMNGIGWTAEFRDGLSTAQGQALTLPLAILIALLLAKLSLTKGTAENE